MQVFHLKYRPRTIADLDLGEVVKTLKSLLNSSDIPQSLLFSGPKGAGKTSAARIVARAVNCDSPKDGEPCGKCGNCQEILAGNSMDVVEIDAASNRGIEEARSLKDKAYLMPARLSKKVFIIDEVHMMTRDAFNALLKLIEEPPKHTIFILCTTDEEKIPETVLSRLFKVRFYKGNRDELKKSLLRVIKGEKLKIDDEAIDLMIDHSDGSFRNLQKTFNEICMEFGDKVSAGQTKAYFEGKFGEYTASELEADLVAGEVKVILHKLEKLAAKGVNFKSFRENLLSYFQEKLLAEYGVGDKAGSKLGPVRLERWLGLLINAGRQEKEVFLEQLPLQLAVVEFLNEGGGKSLKVEIPKETKKTEKKETEAEVKTEVIESQPVNVVNVEFGVDRIEADWGKVLAAVKPYNHSVEAFLRAARPKALKGNLLHLDVFYPFHKDKLEEPKNRKIVEAGLMEVFQVQMFFECGLSQGEKKSLVINNDTPAKMVSEKLAAADGETDIYDVAKQIFG